MTYTTSYALSTVKPTFAANTYTFGDQTYKDLVALSGGGFIVAYDTLLDFYGPGLTPVSNYVVTPGFITSMSAYDTGNVAILERTGGGNDLVQIFDGSGHQVGTSFDISDLAGSVGVPQITALDNGSFLVTYVTHPDDYDLFYREYNNVGTLISTRHVDTDNGFGNSHSSVTKLDDGGFVITHDMNYGDGGFDINVSIFNQDGSIRVADKGLLGVGTSQTYGSESITALQDGGFAVAYIYSDSDQNLVVLRTYNSSGSETGTSHIVSTTGSTTTPKIAVLENGFIAVGFSSVTGGTTQNYLSIFDDSVNPLVGSTAVPVPAGDLTALLGGEFSFSRTDPVVDGSGNGVGVTVLGLGRYSTGTEAGDPFFGDQLTDVVHAKGGADLVAGAGGADSLYGEAGEDFMNGNEGNDLLYGGTENDILSGDTGNDTLSGDEGNDSISGDAGSDVALGGAGDDSLSGGADADILYGNDGTDRLDGGSGLDQLFGGAGNDTYVLGDVSAARRAYIYDTVSEESGAASGVDTVLVTPFAGALNPRGYTLTANVENGTVLGTLDFNLTGNILANVLTGNDGVNRLTGMAGKDNLTGGAGKDQFVFSDVVAGSPGGWGKDVISDFQRGADVIDFSGASALHKFKQLSITNVNGHAVIATGHGDTIELFGVTAAQLKAGDFVFAPSQGEHLAAASGWHPSALWHEALHVYLA